MAYSPLSFNLLFTSLILFISTSTSQKTPSNNPHALILPVTKDISTNQHITRIYQRAPGIPISLTVDLGKANLWVDCENNYISKSYKNAKCNSPPCKLAGSGSCQSCYMGPSPGCNTNTCTTSVTNEVTDRLTDVGEVALDVMYLQSTNGSKPGKLISVPGYVFVCGNTKILEGLPKGVSGMVGLGRAQIGLPYQIFKAFNLPKKFGICLSSLPRSSPGAIFIGDKPYVFPSQGDVSVYLHYTPLITRPFSIPGTNFRNDPSPEYFIQVSSIKINGKNVNFNTSFLNMNKEGFGGTKISTTKPYTTMVTPIYNAFVRAFMEQRKNIPRVKPVAPFSLCYKAKHFPNTQVGPNGPFIDLVLHQKDVFWRIYGANSMVKVGRNVVCLGFVDGGNSDTAIVIGSYQIEDNFLQFDLESSRLGFTSTLLLHQTRCSNFNKRTKA
ncbi:hypothetical protein Leryth_008481 [Lithospermum erythrorhizon]|nr:hypothetical protein Leryth_008481 [Lithospermum erythrorhizon]